MLQISKAKKAGAGARYYLNYYLRDTDGHALWHGTGAQCLELSGEIVKSQFNHTLRGFSFDGEIPLVKNAGDKDRVAFWDMVFSVPKSVSVFYVAAPKPVQKAIDAAIFKALTATLDYAEKTYGLSRRGAHGLEWVPARLTFALFRHINSREDQPQIHWHCLLVNLGVRQDGTIATLQTKPMFEAKLSLGFLFRDELTKELVADLGVSIEHQKNDFHIVGVPKELCASNSKRREQIQNYMAERGLSGAIAAKEAAEMTRAPKSHLSQQELFEKWKKSAEQAGWNEEKVEKLLGATFLKTKERTKQTEESQKLNKDRAEDFFQESVNTKKQREQAKQTDFRQGFRRARGDNERQQHSNSFRKSPDEQRAASESIKFPPPDPEVLKAFKAELREATDRIFPENQTRIRIEKMAFAIGRKYDLGARTILDSVDELKLPIHKSFYRIEWRPVFPKAPKWSPAHDFRTPRIVLTNTPRKWNKIYYSKPVPRIGGPNMEFRIQGRTLFPKAPAWSPISKLSIRSLRFAPFRPYAEELKRREKEQKAKTMER